MNEQRGPLAAAGGFSSPLRYDAESNAFKDDDDDVESK